MNDRPQLSIKPRNWPEAVSMGKEKSSKCTKPYRNTDGGKLGRKQANLSRRRNDHAATIKAARDPQAYKTPGSMK
jgi:hypothetical protein